MKCPEAMPAYNVRVAVQMDACWVCLMHMYIFRLNIYCKIIILKVSSLHMWPYTNWSDGEDASRPMWANADYTEDEAGSLRHLRKVTLRVGTEHTASPLRRHKAHISCVLLCSCYRSSHANPHFLGGYVTAVGRENTRIRMPLLHSSWSCWQ